MQSKKYYICDNILSVVYFIDEIPNEAFGHIGKFFIKMNPIDVIFNGEILSEQEFYKLLLKQK